MKWFRHYHGCLTDPKFGSIARKTGQTRERAVFVWLSILESASEAEERGTVTTDIEAIADTLNCDDGDVEAIWQQFAERGMIADGRVSKWDERNPARDDSAARQRAKRERDADVTRTPRDSDAHVTRLDTESDTDTEKKEKGEARARRSPPLTGSRLSEDWHPNSEEIEFAKQSGVDPDTEAPKFRDYWHSVAGAKGRKQDWTATWRNWCRRAADDLKNRKPNTEHHSGVPPAKREVTHAEWQTRVRKFKANGFWPTAYGPRPDAVSTQVPPSILKEFGYDRAA